MSGLRGMVAALLVGAVGGSGTVGYFWYGGHQAAEVTRTALEAQVADAEGRAAAATRRASLLTVQVQLSEVAVDLANKNFGTASEHLANARKGAEAAGAEPLVAELGAIDLTATENIAQQLSQVAASSERVKALLAAP